MYAILDGDIMAYRIAFWADSEGIDGVEDRIKNDMDAWTPKEATDIVVAFSCPREKNFRRDFWPEYKLHREDKQSPDSMRIVLESMYDIASLYGASTYCADRLEADDLIGMMVSQNTKTIGVTIDKDLRQIPGWHWNPDKEPEPMLVDLQSADKVFYKQWLMGDSTDNIWGLWKMGPKKAEKYLDALSPEEWNSGIMQMYLNEDWSKRPEDKTPQMSKEEFALAQARCVRILRFGDYNKDTREVKLWSP